MAIMINTDQIYELIQEHCIDECITEFNNIISSEAKKIYTI